MGDSQRKLDPHLRSDVGASARTPQHPPVNVTEGVEDRALRFEALTNAQRLHKIRSAAAQAAALAGARKEIKRWKYGQQEPRTELRPQDFKF